MTTIFRDGWDWSEKPDDANASAEGNGAYEGDAGQESKQRLAPGVFGVLESRVGFQSEIQTRWSWVS